MRTIVFVMLAMVSLSLASACFAGQVPSHIYTADRIRSANPSIEKYVSTDVGAYMAGANGPDTVNIMSYAAPGSMGSESHYERTGDLPIAMLVAAETDRERAYAIGWMTHWINDYFVHALVNQWGGWFEVADKHHKTLEMLENKYVFAEKASVRKYAPSSIPADTTMTGCDAVYEAFKACFPKAEKYTTKTALADWRRWFFRSTGVIRTASGSFMAAADDGTGVNQAWTTWAAFPNMPTSDQYAQIKKFAAITETTPTKASLKAKVQLYDNKLFKWFLKQWDDAQNDSTRYSEQVCAAATGYISAKDAAQKADYLSQLRAVLPNVSIDQPRGDFDNSKIFPGNVSAKEIYYVCETVDTSTGSKMTSKEGGTQPIKLSGKDAGFDGSDTGEVELDIPVKSDSYKYVLKVSFHGESVLADPDLKDIAWVSAEGVFGAVVKIDGDKTTRAATPLKLTGTVEADEKTKPLVKLRWTNETTKAKLGDGDSVSFISNEAGKFTVKAEAYSTDNGKDTIYSEDSVEIEVTEPEVSVAIEGDTAVEPGASLPLKAVVTAEPAIKKALEIRWTDESGKTSYGKGEQIKFSAKDPGAYPVRAEAFWKPNSKADAIAVGFGSVSITVGKAEASLRIEGSRTARPEQSVTLKAVMDGIKDSEKSKLEYVWTDDTQKTGLGKGETISYKVGKAGAYDISVAAVSKGGDASKPVASAKHTISTDTNTPGKGRITAKLAGVPSDAVKGGSLQVNAEDFRSDGEPYPLYDNADETGALAKKWSAYWQSTHANECEDAEKRGVGASSIVPERPAGWGVETIKIVWKSDPALTFKPAGTRGSDKSAAVLSAEGKFTVWGEIYLSAADRPEAKLVGETEKGTFSVGAPTLSVSIKASKMTLRPGEIAQVRAEVTGGKEPYSYSWTGNHAGTGAAVSTAARRIGPLPLSVNVADAEGRRGSASISMTVDGVKAVLTGVEGKAVYGTKAKLGNKIEGEEAPEDDGLCKKCGQKLGTNKNCLYCVLASHEVTPENEGPGTNPFNATKVQVDPDKAVSTPPGEGQVPIISDPNSVTVPVAPDAGKKRKTDDGKKPKRMIVWQSEPALAFNPPKSEDGATTVTYDRIGTVKLWTEILELKDGVYQTVGETEQVEIEVVPPAFSVSFDPTSAKTGSEVKAVIKTSPAIPAKLLDYVWFEPASSNRMELEKNASAISFKLKDAKPVTLKVEARVPFYGDTLNDNITASYTASQYLMEAKVTGTKPRIWKEGVGLVEVENAFAVDQNVRIRAEFVGEKPSGDVRYQWTVNEGTSMGSSGLGNEVTVSRHEVGTIEAKVQAKDPEGAPFGNATAVVAITVSADDLRKANDRAAKIDLALKADKLAPKLGETVKFTAAVSGGKAPYVYTWTGDVVGRGASATMKADAAGTEEVTLLVRDSKGGSATQSITINVKGAFEVKLTSDKKTLFTGESTAVKAVATGGKAPYTYKWFGTGVTGRGASGNLVAGNPGPAVVTVAVTDAKKKSVKQSVTIEVGSLTPVVEDVPAQSPLGSQIRPRVSFGQASGKSSLPPVKLLWRCEPSVNMQSRMGSDLTNTITLGRPGKISIWVEVLDKEERSMAKSEPKIVEVKTPTFELKFEEQGKDVAAKITPDAPIDSNLYEFKWLRPTAVRTSSDPTVVVFTPDPKLPTDILVRIKVKETSDFLQEFKTQYEAKGDSREDKDKDKAANGDKEPSPRDKFEAEQTAAQQCEQAQTLAANGEFDEAIELVDKAAKVVPAKAEQAKKSISRSAAGWAGNAIVDLDFDRAKHLADVAVELDPKSDEAKQKQAEVQKWSTAWSESEKIRPEFEKLMKAEKPVSADKAYRQISELISRMPAAPKISPLLNDMSNRLAKLRDQNTLAIQPHRLKVMDYMKSKAYANAIPLCKEVLDGEVVPELYQHHKEEFEKWLAECDAQAKKQQDATTAKKPTKPEPTRTETTKKPDSGKKKGNIFDEINGALDKINGALGGDKEKPKPSGQNNSDKPATEPSKPTVVVQVGNTAGCQLTDTSTFTLSSRLRVTQIIIWASWDGSESKMSYKLLGPGGDVIYNSSFRRGDADTYQKNWCNGVDEPNLELAAGTYTVKLSKARIGQNSGTGGNGMIKVVTGGLLVRPSGNAKPTTPELVSKPKPEPGTEPTPTQISKPSTGPGSALRPQGTSGSGCPSGWDTKVVGDVTVCIPGHWAPVPEARGENGAWYTGDKDEPDAGFGILMDGTKQELAKQLEITSQADVKVSGLPAKSYIGKAKSENLIGWLVSVQRSSGPIHFIGVAKPEKWSANKGTLEKILGTVRIGKARQQASAPVVSKPKPKPAPVKPAPRATMVTAIFVNQSSQNVHMFVDGGSCDPSNRVTPGQTRKVSVTMPANGRIKFCAGRNGSVIGSVTWNGDPSDTNRIPKVTWSSSEKLLAVTSLQ